MTRPIYTKRVKRLGEAIYRGVLERPVGAIVAERDPDAPERIVDEAIVYAFARARSWRHIWSRSAEPVGVEHVAFADRVMAKINSHWG